ncbi:MAG TPA: hypothetical protein PLL75_07830, partial [Candidatus Omnitrophota bacterium]|nr:hypothetical protein [Candidatus Omnitrophota bacterium]
MNGDVLTSLLKGAHLDMEERMKQGLWPHPPLKYAEVREHLAAVIQKQEWFPSDLSSPREGVIIQNNNGEFTCHCL